MPEIQEVEKTSSIGPTWPPAESSFDRIKGIKTGEIIKSSEQLLTIANQLHDLYTKSEQSRLSVRVFVKTKLLSHPDIQEMLSMFSEAVVSLDGAGRGFNDASILYLGKNKENRRSNAKELQQGIKWVEEASSLEVRSYQEIQRRVVENGYTLVDIDLKTRTTDESIIQQFVDLYERFGWSANEVREILANPDSVIAVVKDGNKIISAGIGEIAEISTGLRKLKMAELTEAATLSEYQGKGNYTAVSAKLLEGLYKRGVNLAFGECNGRSPGVLKSTARLGRTFSYSTCKELNLPTQGYLSQHVPIEGGEKRSTENNDLFPSYITRSQIADFLSK